MTEHNRDRNMWYTMVVIVQCGHAELSRWVWPESPRRMVSVWGGDAKTASRAEARLQNAGYTRAEVYD